MNVYNEIIQWLEEHEGKMPRSGISKEGKILKREEMTKEERYEVNLYLSFYHSQDKKILDEYEGRPLEEVPEKYRENIEKIENLRKKYGVRIKGKKEVKENRIHNEIIQWLEENERKMPRSGIRKEGKQLKREEMTEEEQYEVSLYHKFNNSTEKQILNEYAGRPIEEVPEEYREKIETLRKLGQFGNILIRMRRIVAKQVRNNQETRKELENLEYQKNNKNINNNSEGIER